jgi:sec-independent protein translocase protein TatA
MPIGAGHTWLLGVLLIIVLIIWGPGKLPDVGSGLGRAIREFRKASHDTRDGLARATSVDTPPAATAAATAGQAAPPASGAAEGRASG